MKVGFFHVDLDARPGGRMYVDRMVRSVRAAMPGVEVVELTKSGPLCVALLEAFASVDGDWLFLDTDVIVQRDVRHVFDQDFDIAVATREGTFKDGEEATKFMSRMPFNKGAVFSRNAWFWSACAQRCATYPKARQEWMGDQVAMNEVLASGGFTQLVLPNEYNYPPKFPRENVSDKHILHFKGKRKAWMLDRRAA